MMLVSALARTVREGVSDARDVCWQQWQLDRCIAVVMAMAAVWI